MIKYVPEETRTQIPLGPGLSELESMEQTGVSDTKIIINKQEFQAQPYV